MWHTGLSGCERVGLSDDTLPSVLIRAATVTDLERLAPLFDAYRQFYAQAADLPKALAYLAERIACGDAELLLALAPDGEALGFAQLYPALCSVDVAAYGVLYDLYVVPQARRAGVARALLQAARDVAVARQWSRLELSTANDNHAAQRLYESMGWQHDRVFRTYKLDLSH